MSRPARVFSNERVIVVGVDGLGRSRMALEWSADEAEIRDAVLRIVCADAAEPENPPSRLPADGSRLSTAASIVEDAIDVVVARRPNVFMRGEILTQPGAPALVAASDGADLLVVGARGKGGIAGHLLGSVSRHCIRHARCPVVVVRGDSSQARWFTGDGRIVVGIDGSAGSDRALRWALEEAVRRGGSVEAVFGWQYPPVGGFVVGPPEGFENLAREVVDVATTHAKEWESGVRLEAAARVGAPVPTLLDASNGAALLVVGSLGRTRLHDALLGSVATRCADEAICPLVVVPSWVDEGTVSENP